MSDLKLRLLKVIVQPVFIKDDGENLDEVTIQPVTVPAKQWQGFSAEAFGPTDCESLALRIASEQG